MHRFRLLLFRWRCLHKTLLVTDFCTHTSLYPLQRTSPPASQPTREPTSHHCPHHSPHVTGSNLQLTPLTALQVEGGTVASVEETKTGATGSHKLYVFYTLMSCAAVCVSCPQIGEPASSNKSVVTCAPCVRNPCERGGGRQVDVLVRWHPVQAAGPRCAHVTSTKHRWREDTTSSHANEKRFQLLLNRNRPR